MTSAYGGAIAPVNLLQWPTKSKVDQSGSRLLSLPLEVADRIVSHLPQSSLLSLVLTSIALYERYRLRLLHAFAKFGRRDVFYLVGAGPSEFGYKPFSIVSARYGSQQGQGGQDTKTWLLDTRQHNPTEFHHWQPTRDYYVVGVTCDGQAVLDDMHGVGIDNVTRHRDGRPWAGFRGRLRKMTAKLLRFRFTCPECHGKGEVRYGDFGLSHRCVETLR